MTSVFRSEKKAKLIIINILHVIYSEKRSEDTVGLFGPRKIMVTLEKYDYKPGDTIKGTVTLQLKKPMNARKLDVGLIGRKIQQQSGIRVGMPSGSHTSGYHKTTEYSTIYDFRIPLAGEQEYLEGSYPFEIKIPPTILQGEITSDGGIGAAVNMLRALGGVSSRIEWMVIARLDVPLKLDVSASQKIVLS